MTFDEPTRLARFPIAREGAFLAHAAVTALPEAVAHAMGRYAQACSTQHQEFGDFLDDLKATRHLAARLIGARASEIALLGPTSLGLSLFAGGIDWKPGDEVLCYRDDYPANVYPWMELARRGVVVRFLEPEEPGAITPELVERALTPKTRLVALASAHFLTGYRLDIGAIGQLLHGRGVLFSLDGIQTCGAFPTPVEHVDFMSADAHKWLLGPMAIGIVYVSEDRFEELRPTLLGAWNVHSPDFITQDAIRFVPTAQRYEPGVLNGTGILGFKAALELLLDVGIDAIAGRLMQLKAHLLDGLDALGCEVVGPREGPAAHAITTFAPPGGHAAGALFDHLTAAGITASCRKDRSGKEFLRFSPHFYNTEAELDRAIEALRTGLERGGRRGLIPRRPGFDPQFGPC